MKNEKSPKCSASNFRQGEIKDEVKQATQEMNLDAPYADVDSSAADVPETVVKDL